MAALPPALGVLRFSLAGLFTGGQPWLTRFFLHYAGTAPTVAQLQILTGQAEAAWNSSLAPLASTFVQLAEIEAIDLSTDTSAEYLQTVAHNGTRTGTELPSTACAVVGYTVNRRYRGGHPRGYFPFGVTADLTNPAQWSAAFMTSVNTGVNALFTQIIGGVWAGGGPMTHVNVSYYKGNTVVLDPIDPTHGRAQNKPTLRATPLIDTVTAIACRQGVGTQRRRGVFL